MNDDLSPENKKDENYTTIFFSELKKYWIFGSIAFFLPVTLSYFWANHNSLYQTRMLVHIDSFSQREIGYFFQNFSTAVTNKDYSTLSKTYFLKQDVSKKLRYVQIERVKDQRESYIITISVSDTTAIRSTEIAIVTYMQSNNYLKSLIANNKTTYLHLIDSLRADINQLSSLRELAYKNKMQSESIPYYMASINSSFSGLREKEKNAVLELNKIKGFATIESFSIPSMRIKETLQKYTLFGIAVGSILSFLLLTEVTPRFKK